MKIWVTTFAKNFKVRDVSGKVKDQMQTIGQTGKSSRFATCFVHIIPDEDEYNKNEELYLNTLLSKSNPNLSFTIINVFLTTFSMYPNHQLHAIFHFHVTELTVR